MERKETEKKKEIDVRSILVHDNRHRIRVESIGGRDHDLSKSDT
jgi:hypothetical protein